MTIFLQSTNAQGHDVTFLECEVAGKIGLTDSSLSVALPDGVILRGLSRRHGELTTLLGSYTGLLHSDAYGAYNSYAQREGVIALGCMAHARRKFVEALKNSRRESALVLKLIGKLYACEDTYRLEQIAPATRKNRRKSEQSRTLKCLRVVLRICAARALPKSALGKACAYAQTEWPKLIRYLEHGEAEIDNNLIENAIRPSALGKKNFLFIGHPEAGQRSAIIYSIVVSCERYGVDPLSYIKNLLQRLPTMTNQDDIASLVPSRYAEGRKDLYNM